MDGVAGWVGPNSHNRPRGPKPAGPPTPTRYIQIMAGADRKTGFGAAAAHRNRARRREDGETKERRPGGGRRPGRRASGGRTTTDWVVIRRARAPGRRRGNPWMSKTDNRAAANDGDGKGTSQVRPERAARASAEPSGLRGRRGACDPTRPQAAVDGGMLRLRIETETRQAAPPAGSARIPEPEGTCRIAAPTTGKRPAVPGPARPHRPGADTEDYESTWVPGLWGRAAVTKILPVSIVPVTADACC